MAVSRRLRYEILRRDNHACRYCGATAPETSLQVDHVIPISLGGSDAAENLVAACVDCNTGKSSSNPDAPLLDDVAIDAIRWAAAIRQVAMERMSDLAIRNERRDDFVEAWQRWETNQRRQTVPVDENWRRSIDNFYAAGLLLADLKDAMEIAMTARTVPLGGVWKYFCGVCWTVVRERQARAIDLVNDPAWVVPVESPDEPF